MEVNAADYEWLTQVCRHHAQRSLEDGIATDVAMGNKLDRNKLLLKNYCMLCYNIILIYLFPSIAVESYLAKSKDGQWGVTGEGSMLENAAGEYF